MGTVAASFTWSGPEIDTLLLYVKPRCDRWVAEPAEHNGLILLLYGIDAHDEPTDELTALEIVGFSDFTRWDTLPDLPFRWQLPGDTPRSLKNVLMEIQHRIATPTHAMR